MSGWKIKTDVSHGETHDALRAELAAVEDKVDAVEYAQADAAVALALTALSLVGDASVDPSVKVTLSGHAGEAITLDVARVAGKGAKAIKETPSPTPEEQLAELEEKS